MNNEIKQIANKYKYNQTLRKYSNKYYFHDNSIYRSIQSNRDVEGAYNLVVNSIEAYSKTYPLYSDDIIALEKAVARYEIAVLKVLSFYADISTNNIPYSYTANELQEMINNINEFYDKVADISFRKACQD